MRVLIIEDEQIAAERLMRLLSELDESSEIIGHLDSVKTSVSWLRQNKEPDLLFLDIQLADGLSFEIFDQLPVNCPIIFTTAYSEYAVQAFRVNSVDYLLKPIAKEALAQAMEKYRSRAINVGFDASLLVDMLQNVKSYKERFVIKVGEHLKSVLSADVEIFYSKEKSTYLQTRSGLKYIVDFALDNLEEMTDPTQFFRVNRKQIVHIDSISDIIAYSSSRLMVKLMTFSEDEIIVARDRVSQFKSWLDR